MRLSVASLGIVLTSGAIWASQSVGCATDHNTAVDGGADSTASTGAEDTLEACKNGKDDDGDGFKDCYDKGCYNAKDKTGPAKSYCLGTDKAEDTLAACSDGIDNDGNGYIDCNDFSCTKINPACESTNALCSDKIDNDGNGYTDCNDNQCSKNPAVTVCGGDGGTPDAAPPVDAAPDAPPVDAAVDAITPADATAADATPPVDAGAGD